LKFLGSLTRSVRQVSFNEVKIPNDESYKEVKKADGKEIRKCSKKICSMMGKVVSLVSSDVEVLEMFRGETH